MTHRWKTGIGLLALALLVLTCSLLLQLVMSPDADRSGYLELSEDRVLFWVERERVQPDQTIEGIDLSLQVNDYFWTTDRVLYFNIVDLRNTGRRERETLVVDLTAINQSNRRLPLAFCYVSDVDGQKFEAVISNAISFEESLFAGSTIELGENLRGKIAFAVPQGHLPLWIGCAEYSATAKIE